MEVCIFAQPEYPSETQIFESCIAGPSCNGRSGNYLYFSALGLILYAVILQLTDRLRQLSQSTRLDGIPPFLEVHYCALGKWRRVHLLKTPQPLRLILEQVAKESGTLPFVGEARPRGYCIAEYGLHYRAEKLPHFFLSLLSAIIFASFVFLRRLRAMDDGGGRSRKGLKMADEVVRCPYCVLGDDFRPMLQRPEWFIREQLRPCSAYRRPGLQMLLRQVSGTTSGVISRRQNMESYNTGPQ
jgi:hypothetical protein